MDDDVRRWMNEYVEVYASCGRGAREPRALLGYWGVPLLMATGDGTLVLATQDDVVVAAQHQVERLRSAGFARSEVLECEITGCNERAAVCRGTFSWQRAGGEEIARPTVTFLLTVGPEGRRIAAYVPDSP